MAARLHGGSEVRGDQEVRSHFHQTLAVISARLLSQAERITFADLLHARRSIRGIAIQRTATIAGNLELREFVREHL